MSIDSYYVMARAGRSRQLGGRSRQLGGKETKKDCYKF